MKKVFALILLFGLTYTLDAHPGIGIVKDSRGNIYYTDLTHVWKVDLAGKRTIAVREVHTHELYIDNNDDVFGEHVWYNGDRLKTWGHYVWCLRKGGNVVKIKKESEGFLSDYSFARDGAGNMYWVEKFKVSRFQKKTRDGKISTIAEGKWKDVRWIYVSKKGVVYFINEGNLYKILPGGKLTQVAANLSSDTPAFAIYSPRHSLMGIWIDNDENVYVANFSGQSVKRIANDGSVSTVYNSVSSWSPSGGVFDEEGNLWLLEYSLTNEARATKIDKSRFNRKT